MRSFAVRLPLPAAGGRNQSAGLVPCAWHWRHMGRPHRQRDGLADERRARSCGRSGIRPRCRAVIVAAGRCPRCGMDCSRGSVLRSARVRRGCVRCLSLRQFRAHPAAQRLPSQGASHLAFDDDRHDDARRTERRRGHVLVRSRQAHRQAAARGERQAHRLGHPALGSRAWHQPPVAQSGDRAGSRHLPRPYALRNELARHHRRLPPAPVVAARVVPVLAVGLVRGRWVQVRARAR